MDGYDTTLRAFFTSLAATQELPIGELAASHDPEKFIAGLDTAIAAVFRKDHA